MTEDQDNAGEVVAGAVRVALTAAGQLAEQAARRREADLREAERDSTARVATLQSQLATERELALRSVRDVVQQGDVATVEEVVRAWEQARSWDDSAMASERTQLENLMRERFGVDGPSPSTDRSVGEQVEAATMVTRDADRQLEDAHHRAAEQNRVAAMQGTFVDAGIDNEAAAARALAAESHPTSVASAAQRPATISTGRRPQKQRTRSVEVHKPGR